MPLICSPSWHQGFLHCPFYNGLPEPVHVDYVHGLDDVDRVLRAVRDAAPGVPEGEVELCRSNILDELETGPTTRKPPPVSNIKTAWGPMPQEWVTTKPPQRRYLLRHPTRQGKPCPPKQGDGFLPLGKAGCISAEGGSGKTRMMVQLGISIITERRWLDHFDIDSDVIGTGRVALLLGEADALEAHEIVFHVSERLGLDEDERQAVRENLVILTLSGKRCPMLRINPANGEVERTQELLDLVELLDNDPDGFVLLVIDPQIRFAGIDVESQSMLATLWVEECEALTLPDNSRGRTVLTMVHTSKDDRKAGKADARGVTAQTDGFRWHCALTKDGEMALEMTMRKNNLAPPMPDKVRILRTDHGILTAESAEQATERQQAVHQAAQEARESRLDEKDATTDRRTAKRFREHLRRILDTVAKAEKPFTAAGAMAVAAGIGRRDEGLAVVGAAISEGYLDQDGKGKPITMTSKGEKERRNGSR